MGSTIVQKGEKVVFRQQNQRKATQCKQAQSMDSARVPLTFATNVLHCLEDVTATSGVEV